MSLDFSNFSSKDIKKFKVFWDVIRGKLEISDLKKLYKMYKIMDNLVNKKKFRFKDLKDLKPKYFILLINIHNKYTKRDDIDIEDFVELFVNAVRKIDKLLEENPEIEAYLERLIKVRNILKGRGLLQSIFTL